MDPLASFVVRAFFLLLAAAGVLFLCGSCWLGFMKQWRKTRPISTYGDAVMSLHSGHDHVPGGPGVRPRVAHLKIGNPLEVEYLLDTTERGAAAIKVQKVWAYGGAVKVDVTATLELVGTPVMSRIVQEISDLEAAREFARRKA